MILSNPGGLAAGGQRTNFLLAIIDALVELAAGGVSVGNVMAALNSGTSIIFGVIGHNNGAGVADAETQVKINALIATGISEDRIVWFDKGTAPGGATNGVLSVPQRS